MQFAERAVVRVEQLLARDGSLPAYARYCVLANIAAVHSAANRHAETLDFARQAAALRPDDPKAETNLAFAELAAGDRELFVRKQGENQQDYYMVTLEDFIVSSYQSGGSNGSHHLPTDQFALNFAKVKFEYKPQKDDGSLEAAVTAGWDLKQNKKTG